MILWSDKRGVSTAVEYALTLLIAFSILGGVSAGVTSVTDSNEQQVTENQLEIAGNEIAAQLQQQDMIRQEYENDEWLFDGSGFAQENREFTTKTYVKTPERTASESYTVQITPDGENILLQAAESGHTVEVPVGNDIPIAESSGAPGSAVLIEYDTDNDEFQLREGGD